MAAARNVSEFPDVFEFIPKAILGHLHQAESEAREAPLDIGQFPKVRFCITCFRRGFQLKAVLHWALLCALPYHRARSFRLVVFGEQDPDTNDLL